jgi:hypothetical protein
MSSRLHRIDSLATILLAGILLLAFGIRAAAFTSMILVD